MRIVGGRLKGRPLAAPEGRDTRPSSERSREALFNILEHNGRLEALAGHPLLPDARVLDGFAGTGALGLEALSRGAREAVFLENDRAALTALRANIANLGVVTQCRVLAGDALAPPKAEGLGGPASLAFLDPPYDQGLGGPAIEALLGAGWLTQGSVVLLETGPRDEPPDLQQLTLFDQRRFGKAHVAIFVVED